MNYSKEDESVCRQCKKPIIFTGKYWEHIGMQPRHIPEPGAIRKRYDLGYREKQKCIDLDAENERLTAENAELRQRLDIQLGRSAGRLPDSEAAEFHAAVDAAQDIFSDYKSEFERIVEEVKEHSESLGDELIMNMALLLDEHQNLIEAQNHAFSAGITKGGNDG